MATPSDEDARALPSPAGKLTKKHGACSAEIMKFDVPIRVSRQNSTIRPVGLMDKASASGAGDRGLEAQWGTKHWLMCSYLSVQGLQTRVGVKDCNTIKHTSELKRSTKGV